LRRTGSSFLSCVTAPWPGVCGEVGVAIAPSARAQGAAMRHARPHLKGTEVALCGRGRRWPSSGGSGEIAPPAGPRRPLPRGLAATRSGANVDGGRLARCGCVLWGPERLADSWPSG